MDDDENENQNVFKFGAVTGGKASNDEQPEDKIPHNDYVVVDINDHEFDVNGFLIFTPHHLAIMQDLGAGAIPALVIPIGSVQFAGLASVIND